MTAPDANRAKLKLLLLAILFIVPVVSAIVLYRLDWRPARTTNHGELIQPPRPLPATALRDQSGKPVRFEAGPGGKWTMLYLAGAECAAACEQALYKMRQVHLAQGGEGDRVRRVAVVADARAHEWLKPKQQDYADMQVWDGEPAAMAGVISLFAGGRHGDEVYLVDPQGNYMMRYRPDADATGMRKDLKHLLKLSKTG